MTTISVPIPASLEAFIKEMIDNGFAANKADVVRKALFFLTEEEAVNVVLRGQREGREGKNLSGDLDALANKFSGWKS